MMPNPLVSSVHDHVDLYIHFSCVVGKLRSRLLPHTVFDPFQDYSGTELYCYSCVKTCMLVLTAVGSRIAHSSKHGSEKDKQNLAEIFRPPHDLLFNGTFHEVCKLHRASSQFAGCFDGKICPCTKINSGQVKINFAQI